MLNRIDDSSHSYLISGHQYFTIMNNVFFGIFFWVEFVPFFLFGYFSPYPGCEETG